MFMDHIHDQLGKYRVGVINDAMPEMVKVAEDEVVTQDLTKLADGCFAHRDGRERYFPIHTPEHAWMSRAYLEKFAHTMDEAVASKIRSRVNDACEAFELPPLEVEKFASHEDDMDALHTLSIELNKFLHGYKALSPMERRIRAKEILKHAVALGRTSGVPEVIQRYGGDSLHPEFAHAISNRMQHFRQGAPERSILMDLHRSAHDHPAENIAKALLGFDRRTGLNSRYDIDLADPFFGVLSGHAPAPERTEIDGHTIDEEAVRGFDPASLGDILSDEAIESFKGDPIQAIRSMNPHVRVIVIKKIHA